MKTVSAAEVGSDFDVYLKASRKEPVVVTRNGKPVAVLMGTTGQDDLERLLMGHSPQLQAVLEASRRRFREGKGIPHDEFWKQVEAKTKAAKSKSVRVRANGGAKKRIGTVNS